MNLAAGVAVLAADSLLTSDHVGCFMQGNGRPWAASAPVPGSNHRQRLFAGKVQPDQQQQQQSGGSSDVQATPSPAVPCPIASTSTQPTARRAAAAVRL